MIFWAYLQRRNVSLLLLREKDGEQRLKYLLRTGSMRHHFVSINALMNVEQTTPSSKATATPREHAATK